MRRRDDARHQPASLCPQRRLPRANAGGHIFASPAVSLVLRFVRDGTAADGSSYRVDLSAVPDHSHQGTETRSVLVKLT
jgi:hypothetical protein